VSLPCLLTPQHIVTLLQNPVTGDTALHTAVRLGNAKSITQFIDQLVQHGANAGLKNRSSKTPDGLLNTLSVSAHRSVKTELMTKLRRYAREYTPKPTAATTSTTTATVSSSTGDSSSTVQPQAAKGTTTINQVTLQLQANVKCCNSVHSEYHTLLDTYS
jgi:ankyrin repeat protein